MINQPLREVRRFAEAEGRDPAGIDAILRNNPTTESTVPEIADIIPRMGDETDVDHVFVVHPPGRPGCGPDPGTAASDDGSVPLKAEPQDGAVRPSGRVIASVPRARSRWRHRANGAGRGSQPASSDTSSTY